MHGEGSLIAVWIEDIIPSMLSPNVRARKRWREGNTGYRWQRALASALSQALKGTLARVVRHALPFWATEPRSAANGIVLGVL